MNDIQKITAHNIMSHIQAKKQELEKLEQLNEQMMKEAVTRAKSGGRTRQMRRFKAKIERGGSVNSSPSASRSPIKD